MAITLVSRPAFFHPAYLPARYVLTSNRYPNTIVGESAVLTSVRTPTVSELTNALFVANGLVATDVLATFNGTSFPAANYAVGDYVRVASNTLYDGVWRITKKIDAGRVTLQVADLGTGTGGTIAKEYRNFALEVETWVDGALVATDRLRPDTANQFVLDCSSYLRRRVAQDLKNPGEMALSKSLTSGKTFFIRYAERYDVPNSVGNQADSELFGFTSDAGSYRIATNTVIPYAEVIARTLESTAYDLTDYWIYSGGPTLRRFLTNMPSDVPIAAGESFELSALVQHTGTGADTGNIAVERVVEARAADGTILATTSTSLPGNGPGVYNVPCGPANLSASILPSTIAYYNVWLHELGTAAGTKLTETITFRLDTACHPCSYRFHWLSPRGGMDSFTFVGASEARTSVEEETYGRLLSYPRVLPERELTTAVSRPTDTFTANSGMVRRELAEWLREIVKRRDVYLELNGSYLPVHVITKSLDVSSSLAAAGNVAFEWRFAWEEATQYQ